MTWAFKRQIFYLTIFISAVLALSFFIIYPRLNKAPTCTDLKQNGSETGVDCGGACPRACIAEVDEIAVLWARAFRVIPGRYNAVAYLTNHNKTSAVQKINYRFRFADANNVYIGKREGSTYVPPGRDFAVFEPGIDIGNSIPIYTTFEFTEAPEWLQVSQDKINQLKVAVSNIVLTNEETTPVLTAVVKNNSLFTLPEVGVIALLYDAKGNAISVSRTYLEALKDGESKTINFTWPEPLVGGVVEKEIIPLFDIFSVKFK